MAARKFTIDTLRNIIKNHNGRYDRVLEKVNIISVENGNCVAELKVEDEHTNPLGGLHGGFSATLIDTISTYGLFAAAGVPSVSVDIHATYIKGAKVGEEIVISSKTLKTGKSLAFLEVYITNKKSGEVLVKGSHTKFLLQPKQ